MPRTIRISDETWERLKAWARPLEDSADDVVVRVLDQAGDPPTVPALVPQPTPPTEGSRVLHERPPRSKRTRTIVLLLARGLLKPGEALVVAPSRLPLGADPGDSTYRARLSSSPDDREKIVWERDGQLYAISRLTEKLRDEHGVSAGKGAVNGNMRWCRAVDPSRTLWELVEETGSPDAA